MTTSFSISPSSPATLIYFLLLRFPFPAPVYGGEGGGRRSSGHDAYTGY